MSLVYNNFNPCSARSLMIGIGHTGNTFGTFDNAKTWLVVRF